ncbi:NAD(P)/FAD-dependent oxidoreductase [Corynebacterium aquilae]|uniref:FAD/NAD(P)-binding domain-containing protein n=1 Tax=Corynebacterium aquilae DSM 44791 TaxID=1431546 RepID=A0A1L7CI30_9CORY|nr:NAD(P)/FAD-dependent oxidoreductase [Corynebacterium aquilae]APT85517.1 hypothetical protein CAQU_11205 [Corynebacterium aquilae DSM 44791]
MSVEQVDVVIVGGSFAGIAAGITLARAMRSVVVIDAGSPRNAAVAHAHSIPGLDGVNPGQFAAQARQEFVGFGGVVLGDEVTSVQRSNRQSDRWRVATAAGRQFVARQVVVATGLTDVLPEIAGLKPLWGTRVFHCPYCHGYETRGLKVAVFGGPNPAFSAFQPLMLLRWADTVVFYPNGMELSPVELQQMRDAGVEIDPRPVGAIAPEDTPGQGVMIRVGGEQHRADVCFVGPDFRPNDELLLAAGCQRVDGWVPTRDGATDLPGLWAVGNVVSSPDQVTQAMGTAVAAAIAIDRTMFFEDLHITSS